MYFFPHESQKKSFYCLDKLKNVVNRINFLKGNKTGDVAVHVYLIKYLVCKNQNHSW